MKGANPKYVYIYIYMNIYCKYNIDDLYLLFVSTIYVYSMYRNLQLSSAKDNVINVSKEATTEQKTLRFPAIAVVTWRQMFLGGSRGQS